MDFLAGEFYHVYNKAQNGARLFLTEEHYKTFLQKIKSELLPYADVVAYCLMPHHYQLIIKVKNHLDFDQEANWMETAESSSNHPLSRKIGALQSSYTQSINKQQHQKGALFEQGAKSKLLKEHAVTCFHYLHQNPVRYKLCEQPEQWVYSSFNDYFGLRSDGFINKEIAYSVFKIPKDKIKLHNQTMVVIRDGMLENVF